MARAFTLIELLVVITIIVVLLALLTPALDKAIYQAELAVCGANLKGIASGATIYAMQNKRCWPAARDPAGSNQPARIGPGASDARKVWKDALGNLNKFMNDPLTGADLDFEASKANTIFGNYNLWAGWGGYAGNS